MVLFYCVSESVKTKNILHKPREVRLAKNKYTRRLIFIGNTNFQEKPIAIVIEIGNKEHLVVTVYICSDRYLSNFDLLWRAAQPPSAYPH